VGSLKQSAPPGGALFDSARAVVLKISHRCAVRNDKHAIRNDNRNRSKGKEFMLNLIDTYHPQNQVDHRTSKNETELRREFLDKFSRPGLRRSQRKGLRQKELQEMDKQVIQR
jgi:hypothetical protein